VALIKGWYEKRYNKKSFYRATACNGTHGIAKAFLSVCPSVCQTHALWQNERNFAHILIPHERTIILVFRHEEWLVGATPCTWNFGPNWPCLSKNADFQSIFARSASAITPREKKSIITNRKSTTRFPMSLRWSSYVACINARKTQNGRFPSKSELHLKKVCYKVFCEYC